MASLQSPLEQQYSMLTDLVRAADDIIGQQTEIKLKTERLKLKNEELQTKSRELQEVLKTSQQQLLSDTTIPIELINQLALVVRNMKESHHSDFQDLIGLLSNVQQQFEKQQAVFEGSVGGDRPQEKQEAPGEESDSGAWKPSKKEEGKVTILQLSKETKPCSASVESPASHSEVVSSDLLASLTRNADNNKGKSNKVISDLTPDLPPSV